MAKRKRLTPPNPDYLEDTPPAAAGGVFPPGLAAPAAGRKPAPIADVARDTSASAALEEMARNWHGARDSGRLVVALAHDEIRLDHLQRDRMVLDGDEMAALKQSLLARGQQTPVEVVALPGGAGYGLLSGWRRCRVMRDLHAETGEARFASVQALLRRPEDAAEAYRTMVEENEIRANLSHYERARIVVKSVEAGAFDTQEAALEGLFGAVPRARRSKIRSFLALVHALDGALPFPEAVSERAGLDLAQRLRDDPGLGARLRGMLNLSDPADPATQQALIARLLRPDAEAPEAPAEIAAETTRIPLSEPKNSDLGSRGGLQADFAGARLTRGQGGALTLSGPAVDDALQAALVDWLSARLGR